MENSQIFELAENHGSWAVSDFQSRYFVVNSQVTDYRRVRQALLEIETRIAAKKQIERNVRKTETQKKIHVRDLTLETDSLKKELIQLDIDQCDYDLSVYQKKYRICLEELDQFAKIVKDLVPDFTTLETYKQQNDEEERNYWVTRLAKQATMDLITIGRIGQGNLDSIAMMPLTDQQETIKAALKYNALLGAVIAKTEKLALEELNSVAIENKFIDQVVKQQFALENNKVQSEDL
jgi:hypothetical protein